MEKLSGKQSGERKDGYGNILYPGEYYSKRHDSYEYRYKGSNGKIRTKGAKTLELLRDAEDKIACDLLGDYSGYRTVERLINMYLDAKNNIDKVTLTGYWNNYKLHVKGSWFGKLEIKQVDESKVLEFYNELVTVAGLKKSTVALINDFVNPSFATVVNYHWIENNPCKTCMKNIQNTKSSTIEILTLEQLISLSKFTELFYPQYYVMIKCLIELKIKIGELLGLTVDNVLLDEKKIIIDHQLSYIKLYGEDVTQFSIKKLRSDEGLKVLYFSNDLRRILSKQIEYAEYVHSVVGTYSIENYSSFLFVSISGKPFTPNGVNKLLSTIVDKYNDMEQKRALLEKRRENLLPHISTRSFQQTSLIK